MLKIKWLSHLLLLINICFGLLLFLSLSSLYIDPLKWWLPSILGLAFIQIFFINLLFLAFWLVLNKKNAIISLVFLTFGFTEIPFHVQFNISDDSESVATKVLTMNVRNFDLYNWSMNKKTRDNILKTINGADADIVCLQEFFNTTDPNHDFVTLDTIMKFKRKFTSHVEYTSTVKGTEHWGISTFSIHPIVGKGKITFENNSNNICIYTDLKIHKDTFRIYNLHLASLKFAKEDYQYIEKVQGRIDKDDVNGGKSLIKKLNNAFVSRSMQSQKVKAHMDQSPFPIILCGDFNDTPTSFAYKNLSEGLQDSFKKKGNGFGSTYNGILPFLRIDYVFADRSIKILKHEVIRNNLSDHFPICVSLELPK